MKINITGKNIDLGETLTGQINDSLPALILEKFNNSTSANVIVSKEGHLFHFNIIVQLGHPFEAISEAQDSDAYAAYNKALEKLEKQLDRHRKKLKNRHKQSLGEASSEAIESIYATDYLIDENDDFTEGEMPAIIAENQTEIMYLTVSEAVIKMDLAGLNGLVFINKKNNNINMIFKREDGNISWIDSKIAYNNKIKAVG